MSGAAEPIATSGMNGQPTPQVAAAPLLEFRNIKVVYDSAIEAVRDVSVAVPQGCIVALLGSNGAGKSTMLKAMSGVLYAERGEVENGAILLRDREITRARPDEIVLAGVIQVPEGRRIFPALTVEENLVVGGFKAKASLVRERRQQAYALFPRLAERRSQIAGYLSGGEQQMLAIARALMGGPKLLALDEPSLGLAPQIIDRIYQVIADLRKEMGLTVLLVEQNAERALEVADYGYILENGRVVLDGPAAKLARNPDVQEFYLGAMGTGERKSMRDVKHYKRRKRWLS
jgi:branched-chain amino acid transport system ATP-binding protein